MDDNEVLDKIGLRGASKAHGSKTRVSFLKKIGVYEYLMNRYPDSDSLQETIYRMVRGIEEKPKCIVCETPLSFKNWHYPKNGYCSVSCSRKAYTNRTQENVSITDEMILSDLIKADGNINNTKVKEKYLTEHGYKEYLNTRYSDSPNWTETVYRIKHHIDTRPTCVICGKPALFKNFVEGYSHVCQQGKKTGKECITCRSGYNLLSVTPEITDECIIDILLKPLEKQNKSKLTSATFHIDSLKRIGVYEYLINRYPDSDSIMETLYRIKYHIEERPKCLYCGGKINFRDYHYGFNNTCRPLCQKRHQSLEGMKRIGLKEVEYKSNASNVLIIKNVCPKHPTFELSYDVYRNRLRFIESKEQLQRFCPICHPERDKETSIEKDIKDILTKNNVKFQQHRRGIIGKKEFDFYLPEYHTAIECNGIFWHSLEQMMNKNAHLYKYRECQQKGINLLYFWEQDIRQYPDIIENIIMMEIGKEIKDSGISNQVINTSEPTERIFQFINQFSIGKIKISPMNITIGSPEDFHTVLGVNKKNDNEIIIEYFFTKKYFQKKELLTITLCQTRVIYPDVKVYYVSLNNEYQSGGIYLSNGFSPYYTIIPKTYEYNTADGTIKEYDKSSINENVKNLHFRNLGWTVYKKVYQ